MAKRRRFDRINSIALLIIAVSALVVSVWQGVENRNFNKMSMKPYLKYDFANQDSVLTISIRNVGMGMAIINNLDVQVDGKSYDTWDDVLSAISEDMTMVSQLWVSDGEILTPHESMNLVSAKTVDFGGKQLSIKIDFESMYGEEMTRSFSYSFFIEPQND